jgi:hypothetical protein
MSALARPGVLASILAAAAVALHPALGAARWLPARPAVLAALLVLAVLALAARAAGAREGRTGAALAAAGAAVLVGALAVDGLRGHHGALSLAPGESRGNFEEAGPDGRSLGLRPLGFPIGAGRVSAGDGSSAPAVALALPGRSAPVELTPERSVAFGGYRFARPVATTTGGVARLRVAASDGAATQVAEVSPGAPGRAFGLTIALEEYFPDFALDESRRPFSRSAEPRNPAALLSVEKAGEAHRVFVLQSMPGVHRVEALGLAFSLLGVEFERTVAVAVHREPAALAALLGALVLAAGVALSLRRGTAPASVDGDTRATVAGGVLVGLLLVADRGAVLAWSLALAGAGGRVPLPGVGVLLGAALVAALGGSLLLGAGRLAGDGAAGARPAARAALWLAAGLAAAGLCLAVVRVQGLPGARPTLLPLAGIALGVLWLGASLVATRPAPPPLVSRVAPLVLPAAVLAALGLAIALAVAGVLRDGTYATSTAAAAASAALLGLAALEPAGVPGLRRFAFLLALLAPATR